MIAPRQYRTYGRSRPRRSVLRMRGRPRMVNAIRATPSNAVSISCSEWASNGNGRYNTVAAASGNWIGLLTTTGLNTEPPSADCAEASFSVFVIDEWLNAEMPKNDFAD